MDLIIFPMSKRVGRIRDVAVKMLDKPTERSAEHYRRQVTEAILTGLDRIGVVEQEKAAHVSEFWKAVENEVGRIAYCGHGTGGAA